MDYSLLVGLHFRDDNTGEKMGLSPFLLRTGNLLLSFVLCVAKFIGTETFMYGPVYLFRKERFTSEREVYALVSVLRGRATRHGSCFSWAVCSCLKFVWIN